MKFQLHCKVKFKVNYYLLESKLLVIMFGQRNRIVIYILTTRYVMTFNEEIRKMLSLDHYANDQRLL